MVDDVVIRSVGRTSADVRRKLPVELLGDSWVDAPAELEDVPEVDASVAAVPGVAPAIPAPAATARPAEVTKPHPQQAILDHPFIRRLLIALDS